MADLSTTQTSEELVTRPEASRLLGYRGVTSHTLRRLELRGLLTPLRITPRAIRYRRSDLNRLIASLSS